MLKERGLFVLSILPLQTARRHLQSGLLGLEPYLGQAPTRTGFANRLAPSSAPACWTWCGTSPGAAWRPGPRLSGESSEVEPGQAATPSSRQRSCWRELTFASSLRAGKYLPRGGDQ